MTCEVDTPETSMNLKTRATALVEVCYFLLSVSFISQFYKDVLEVGELAKLGNLL